MIVISQMSTTKRLTLPALRALIMESQMIANMLDEIYAEWPAAMAEWDAIMWGSMPPPHPKSEREAQENGLSSSFFFVSPDGRFMAQDETGNEYKWDARHAFWLDI